jgi:hypothetical protein
MSIDDGWGLPQLVGLALKKYGLSLQPEILERGAFPLAQVGRNHPLRLADQECMVESCEVVIG